MQIYATFEHSTYLELAIAQLQQSGVDHIFAVPLDEIKDHPEIFDTIHKSDGVSFINKGIALSVTLSVVLASRGFLLKWGPIIWGLIGATGGLILGVAIDLIIYKLKHKAVRGRKKIAAEVILIIECDEKEEKTVTDIIKYNLALGLAKIN